MAIADYCEVQQNTGYYKTRSRKLIGSNGYDEFLRSATKPYEPSLIANNSYRKVSCQSLVLEALAKLPNLSRGGR